MIDGLDSDEATAVLGDMADEFREEIELVKGACPELSVDDYLAAKQTPVFFGSAISNFGVKELLDEFVSMRRRHCHTKASSAMSIRRKKS